MDTLDSVCLLLSQLLLEYLLLPSQLLLKLSHQSLLLLLHPSLGLWDGSLGQPLLTQLCEHILH